MMINLTAKHSTISRKRNQGIPTMAFYRDEEPLSKPTMCSSQEEEVSNGCKSAVLSLFGAAILLAFLIGSGLYMYANYGPETKPLVLRLNSLYASNFSFSRSPLLATWDARLTTENVRDNLRLRIYLLESSLYYREHEISCASGFDPIQVISKEQRSVDLFFNRLECRGEQPVLDDELYEDICEDRDRGNLRLSLKMQMDICYEMIRSPWSWRRRIGVKCPELDVRVEAMKGVGRLVGVGDGDGDGDGENSLLCTLSLL